MSTCVPLCLGMHLRGGRCYPGNRVDHAALAATELSPPNLTALRELADRAARIVLPVRDLGSASPSPPRGRPPRRPPEFLGGPARRTLDPLLILTACGDRQNHAFVLLDELTAKPPPGTRAAADVAVRWSTAVIHQARFWGRSGGGPDISLSASRPARSRSIAASNPAGPVPIHRSQHLDRRSRSIEASTFAATSGSIESSVLAAPAGSIAGSTAAPGPGPSPPSPRPHGPTQVGGRQCAGRPSAPSTP